jgi:flavin-dependent dehydrogenase
VVDLVDARRGGAPKCCGHCLHPRGLELLRTLDPMSADAVLARAHGRTPRGRVVLAPDRIVAATAFDDGGVVVAREDLDPILLDGAVRAGARLHQPATARIERLDESGATVVVGSHDGSVERIEADLVVGADGLGSAVARAAGLVDRSRLGRKFGFSCPLPADALDEDALRADEVVLCVGDRGYLGLVREGVHRVHAAALVAGPGPGCAPAAVLASFARSHPQLASLARFSPQRSAISAAGPMPWRTLARTAPCVALVGDAAGYVEPFTGEGMTWAIESALFLIDACADGRFGPRERDRYELAWTRALGARQNRCALVARLVERPRVLRSFAFVRTLSPKLAGSVARRLVPR